MNKCSCHCEQSEAIQYFSATHMFWIAALTLAMTILTFPAHAAQKNKTVQKSYSTALMKLDTTNPATFECGNITSPVQDAICRGGLIQTNIDLVKDVNELSLSMGATAQPMVSKAQAAWRASRNANCEMESFARAEKGTGSLAMASFVFCVIANNKERHRYLQNLILTGHK